MCDTHKTEHVDSDRLFRVTGATCTLSTSSIQYLTLCNEYNKNSSYLRVEGPPSEPDCCCFYQLVHTYCERLETGFAPCEEASGKSPVFCTLCKCLVT